MTWDRKKKAPWSVELQVGSDHRGRVHQELWITPSNTMIPPPHLPRPLQSDSQDQGLTVTAQSWVVHECNAGGMMFSANLDLLATPRHGMRLDPASREPGNGLLHCVGEPRVPETANLVALSTSSRYFQGWLCVLNMAIEQQTFLSSHLQSYVGNLLKNYRLTSIRSHGRHYGQDFCF